ncbi:uncharacterized protein [Oscarella lobularis]|uniref:uncharacterized protein n=1 Tax=Oscarella lobularis TaxID=121494 RepID=UPI0033144550
MKKRRSPCGITVASLAAIAVLTLALNLFSITSSCFWSGSDGGGGGAGRIGSSSNVNQPLWEIGERGGGGDDDDDVADLQNRLISSQEEVARLRRQILSPDVDSDECAGASIVARPRDPYKPTSRHAVIEWDSFDEKFVFSSFMNGRTQPGDRVQGIARQDLIDAKEAALELINRDDEGKKYRFAKLVHGFRRTDRLRGTEYELDLQLTSIDGPTSKRVRLLRPFGEPLLERVATYEDLSVHVNLVMPLAGRFEIFEQFMYRFRKCCIGQKFVDVFLILVYFGDENKEDVKKLLAKYRDVFSWKNYELIAVNGPFSRGVGLLKGAEYVRDSVTDHRVMFFCDVDIRFTSAFLQRCHRNADLGKRVYYPVVFSMYNPALSTSKSSRSSSATISIKRESGFWRDFGYGMVCLYVEDFFNVGGFDLSIEGWGGEDVDLYSKFVQSGLETMRSVDEGIYHVWHEKLCEPELSPEQYQSCMNSKISTSGSQKQLGNVIIEQQERINQLEKEIDVEKKLLSAKGVLNASASSYAGGASRLAAAGKSEAKKRGLKIYVYDLPSEFNKKQIEKNEKDPPPIWNYDCKVNAFGAEYAIHQSLMRSEFRTENAAEADFYFVPIYASCHYINAQNEGDDRTANEETVQFVLRALQHVRTRYDYFNRSAGRDHVWTFTMGFVDDDENELYASLKNGVFLLQSALLASRYFNPHKDVVISSYVDPDEVVAIYSVPFIDRPTRTILAHYSGAHFKSERGRTATATLTNAIVKQYSRVPRFRIAATRMKTYFLDMMSSVFCLCPVGDDEPTAMQRVYESIILGCIPVLIGPDVELAFADRVDYSKFVVRVRANRVDRLHTILLNVRQEEIVAMRFEMERSWTAVSYDKKVGHVLDNVIYSLVRRKPEQSMKLVYRDH